MSFIGLDKIDLGNPVISESATCVTAAHFAYQQNQVDKFTSTATAGYYLSISMRIKAKNVAAEQKYGYEDLEKDFQTFNVLFDTTPHVTAAAMAVLIQAAFPLLLVTETGGVITIGTNNNYGLEIEYEYYKKATYLSVTPAVDLTTTSGDALIQATVKGGNIRYWETGETPTTTSGLLVLAGAPFDVLGTKNIINALFIEESSGSPATVNYEVYTG